MQEIPPKREDPDHPDELVHQDDRIIGRAFRWSLIALVVIGVAVGIGVVLVTRKPAEPPAQITKLTAPVAPDRPQTEIPQTRFTDITASAGITFLHNNGAYGDKLLPETMGGGVAFFDFDNDGDQDLLLVNSTYWPDHIPTGKKRTTM